jgi:hypothetical protein
MVTTHGAVGLGEGIAIGRRFSWIGRSHGYASSDFCIEGNMYRLGQSLHLFPLTLLLSVLVYAGTPGSFRGKIVEGPHSGTERNWIYIQARNGMVRRVEVSHARVEYDEDVPAARRSSNPQEDLKAGAEVRITAEQGSDGEWRASRIEILNAAVGSHESAISQ